MLICIVLLYVPVGAFHKSELSKEPLQLELVRALVVLSCWLLQTMMTVMLLVLLSWAVYVGSSLVPLGWYYRHVLGYVRDQRADFSDHADHADFARTSR